MKIILFQGDSITDAFRRECEENGLGSGYPKFVAGSLSVDYPGEYKFYNRGISGDRVVDIYARIKADILNLKPDVMSILVGVNDVWHEFDDSNGVDAEKYFKVYSMLIEEIKAELPDIKIMILEPFVLKGTGSEADWEVFRSEVEKRAEKAKQIAEKYNLVFVPLQDKLDEMAQRTEPNEWLRDGVHPTCGGHEIIKREWLKAFKTL